MEKIKHSIRRIVMVVVCYMATMSVYAQYDPSFSHYWMMQSSYNPAAAGLKPALNITAGLSMQMTGFENAPQTMYAGVDLPLFFISPKHGAGVSFLNDEIGLFSHKRFSLQYAYRTKLFGGNLGIGLQGDFMSETFDGTKIDLGETNDPAIASSSVNGSGIGAAVGLWYDHNSWYLGLSAQHVTNPTITMSEIYEIKVDPTYYFTAGYNIRLKIPFLSLHPSVLVKYDGTNYRADITGRVQYAREKKMIYGGIDYSPTNSVGLFVGGRFHGIDLSYSYEAYTSSLGIGHGSHELVVNYQMDLNLYKKGRNKHKSVRLL